LRKFLKHISGTVELKDGLHRISIIDASKGGLRISGKNLPVGSVVRIHMDVPISPPKISLYCKVVWSMGEYSEAKAAGLTFLNTNRILFKEDYLMYSKFLASIES